MRTVANCIVYSICEQFFYKILRKKYSIELELYL
nr:MAG TPA_asm: hypothetical protein [Caudoviricetes sp.]